MSGGSDKASYNEAGFDSSQTLSNISRSVKVQGEREATERLACRKGLLYTSSQSSCKLLASLYAHRALFLGVSGPGQPRKGCRGNP